LNRLILEALREIPLFRGLSSRNLKRLVTEFQVKDFKKGRVVFHQSDSSTDLYIVLSGSVKASLVNEEGDELTLAEFKKGDFFGEMSLIDGKPRSATITCLEDSTLGILTRNKFIGLLKKEPHISLELLSSLVERLRIANGVIESLAFLDVEERLMRLLCSMVEECGERTDSGLYRIRKCPHRELASRIGASREAVTKALKVLSFKGLVREDRDGYIISPNIFMKNAEFKIK
jgi:CRP/FNR family cyclic AMP-dependent transcriptional regulator